LLFPPGRQSQEYYRIPVKEDRFIRAQQYCLPVTDKLHGQPDPHAQLRAGERDPAVFLPSLLFVYFS